MKDLKQLVLGKHIHIDSRLDLRYKVTWQYLAGEDVYPKYKTKYKHLIVNPWINEDENPFGCNFTINPKETWNIYYYELTKFENSRPKPDTSVFKRDRVFNLREEFNQVFKLDLYSVTVRDIKRVYKDLSFKHHPDYNGNAKDFIYITQLKQKALELCTL
jgi:hypothetical protein